MTDRPGHTKVSINLSKKAIQRLEEIAEEQGCTLQELVDRVGEIALEGFIAVKHPKDGQHR